MNSHVRSVLLPLCFLLAAQSPWLGAQTQPASTTSTQSTPEPQSPTAPPPPPPPDQYKSGNDVSVELLYWLTRLHPAMRSGVANLYPTASSFDFPGHGKPAEGIVVTMPAGRANQLEFSYFTTKGQGNVTASQNLTLFSQGFPSGDIIAGAYKIQSAKVSWNYLTYPDPPGGSKFRFRTLWGLQYTTITASFDAPQDLSVAPVSGSRSMIFPALGVGVEYHVSKNLYVEAKASGFALPHKAAEGDGEAKFVLRFGRIDVVGGGRDVYFKTSPQKDYYLKANMWGPYVGLRYNFK